MSIEDDNGLWQARADSYRDEPLIADAIRSSSRKNLKPDTSLIAEFSNYFIFLRDGEESTRTIRGPADLSRGLSVASELQAIKDRAAEIILFYDNMRSRLERYHDVVKSSLFLKKEVIVLKNDTQRNAVVSLTCPEIEDRLSSVKRVLSSAELVSKNVNQSFNILKTQVDIVKEMMYEGGLSKALRSGDRS